jgi:hypothetical protein
VPASSPAGRPVRASCPAEEAVGCADGVEELGVELAAREELGVDVDPLGAEADPLGAEVDALGAEADALGAGAAGCAAGAGAVWCGCAGWPAKGSWYWLSPALWASAAPGLPSARAATTLAVTTFLDARGMAGTA